MKVLLINISLRPDSPKLIFPIGLGYIATAIERAGFDLKIVDMDAHKYTDKQLRNVLYSETYDVVAMGCLVTGYSIVKRLAKIIKECADVPLIVGNSVASSVPETLLSNTETDVAVIGESDVTIVELLHALAQNTPLDAVNGICYKDGGNIVSTRPRQVIDNVDGIPFINRDLFEMHIYLEQSKLIADEPYLIPYEDIKLMPVNTARGCAHKCTFCYHVFRGTRYRVRSPRQICAEIRMLKNKYGINHIYFWDELTFYAKKQCEAFVDTVLEQDLGIIWRAICRADLFKKTKEDMAILNKLRKAGCFALGFSLESSNPDILKAMNKHLDPNSFLEQCHACDAAGMIHYTSLVIGYPQETEDTIRHTFDTCYEGNVYPSTGYLLPQPGTPIYDYAWEKELITNEEDYLLKMGDRQDFRINLTQMPQERIESLVKENLQRIAEKLDLDIPEDRLIKTGHYNATHTHTSDHH